MRANYPGAEFPYLSANLDVRTDPDLAPLAVPGGQPPRANSIAPSVVLDVNGEPVGVVGATTPLLERISSPDGVTVLPDGRGDGGPDYAALAALIQREVDRLLRANPGLDKVILLAHMQQLAIEAEQLAPRLTGVDIIQAGGSNALLADDTDRLRDGDTADGPYPIFVDGADGNPVAVVNTDGGYAYVGRLVIEFDDSGVIVPSSYDPAVSGAYATDAEGVAALDAGELVDPEIAEIADALKARIVELDRNYFGVTQVYLDGRRSEVRTEETNLGNLTADANLAVARQADPDVRVSLKNGGGIRDAIGRVETPAGGTEPRFLPPAGNALTGKPAGGISQLDIQDSLRVLLVEDSRPARMVMASSLSRYPRSLFEIVEAETCHEAVAMLGWQDFDVVVLDVAGVRVDVPVGEILQQVGLVVGQSPEQAVQDRPRRRLALPLP